MKDDAQLSIDLLIALSIFLITLISSMHFIMSSFVPYRESIELQASAYRVAVMLAEDSGLNESDGVKTDWENADKSSIARVGLAREPSINSPYDRSVPCNLSKNKTEKFFNQSFWGINLADGMDSADSENLTKLGRKITLNDEKFNVSIRYFNNSIYKNYSIGYPIPMNAAKFEELVIVDGEIKRLVVLSGKGQSYLLESVIASFMVLSITYFVLNPPISGSQIEEYSTLQLKKYADNILDILASEYNGTNLSEMVCNFSKFNSTFYRIGEKFKRISIMYKAEIYQDQLVLCNGSCYDVPEAVTSFRPVYSNSSIYEVRLTLWYI